MDMLINIQCHGGVIDSIINQVIFMASTGTSNAMTSIISLLKLHSLYSPLRFSNTLNHFSWEVFFFFLFLTCCFSASPKSSVTSNSPTLYVGHLRLERDDASGTTFVRPHQVRLSDT